MMVQIYWNDLYYRKHALIGAWTAMTDDERLLLARANIIPQKEMQFLLQRKPILRKGDLWTNSLGMEFQRIPSGTFELNRASRWTKCREVQLSSFFLAVAPVTQSQYKSVLGENPSAFSKHGAFRSLVKNADTMNLPVDSVSWHDAAQFCKSLSALKSEERAGRKYRLPTEAEWEYAAREGRESWSSWADGKADDTGDEPVRSILGSPISQFEGPPGPVDEGSKNEYGIRSLGGRPGNALGEWCQDRFGAIVHGPTVNDPRGPSEGDKRVVKGGIFWQRPDADDHFLIISTCGRGAAAPDWHGAAFRVVCETQNRPR